MTSMRTPVRPRSGLPAITSAMPDPRHTARTRVLVVEAMPLAGLGLRAMIDGSRDLASAGTTPSVAAAVAAVARIRPDVVIVDSALDPDAAGARAMLSASPETRVIGLVRDGAANYVRAATQAGVRGLLPRAASPIVIVAGVRAVRAGGHVVDPALTSLLLESRATAATPLSDRQAAVLALIAAGQANATIAETLFVSVETVRTHVKAILQRLGARDRAQAVARGYQLGILGEGRSC